MYWHSSSKRKDSLAHLTPAERKKASDAWDEANSMSVREAAYLRRASMKPKRLADLAVEKGIPRGLQLQREHKERLRAIRASMEKRINEG